MTGWMKQIKRLAGQTCTGLLVVLLAVTLTMAAGAASYMQPYLDKVVGWGVMRGDLEGNLNENNYITRAEFSTMINRAFGYDKTGPTPFQDVPEESWYAEDVGIAYNIGYIAGTSATTFSPEDSITREQAALILARILMLQPQVGENTMFTDSRTMENWSRGYIASVAQQGLISGYPDGRFGPKDNLTRGQAAIILVNALGTPLMEAGDYTLGSVWGNVTISQSGTTLRNTVIGGDLYITEGVDLGQVTLENVTVLGKIVVCGGGASEGGEDSIILRNVTAPELLVDNIDNHFLSLKVEGDGKIDNAYVRTNAYIADNTVDGCGIAKITMDGEENETLTLAGNIKEVIDKAPNTSVSLASGQADTITIDEAAEGATLDIAAGSRVDNVNLDTAVDVTGGGDIGKLTINSDGSTVSMLPDQIVIRPGNTANINGEEMDSAAAAESSADPRLYAGYPKMKDLAPTSGTAVFSANKKGTVYWALTAVTDGSVTADELINPSAYNPKVVKSGTVSLTGSGQEGTSNISGLISDGSYYLSAVFVDARENRSPLKVISFTTPDDTKPDFASGYPYLSKVTSISAQVTVMPTKSCRLYWAVLPKGATAPTEQDFKANAVTGNLGFGNTDVTKNTAYSFDVNNVPLEELESYDLYLWLTDVDNGQSSAIKKLSFTTVDGTPPVFNTEPTINKVDKTSVGLYANLNEDGTLYWVVVPQGEEYPKPLAGQTGAVDLSSDTAKLQVSAGMNALKAGSTNMTQNKDISFTVSGLEAEKAYDLYYVAKDKAGNYSATVGKITIHTLDSNAPTVTQEFTKYNGTDATKPYPNTDIRLVFSETVRDVNTNVWLDEYYNRVTTATGSAKDEARDELGTILRNSIKLYVDDGNGRKELVQDAVDLPAGQNKENGSWTIDYRYAEVKVEDGKTVITFRTTDNSNDSALNLQSGAKYHFEIESNTIADTSDGKNIMGHTELDPFETIFAIVNLSNPNEDMLEGTVTDLEGGSVSFDDESDKIVDISWLLSPVTTESVPDNINWDMIIWSDTSVCFDLYRRTTGTNETNWERVQQGVEITVPNGEERRGVSLARILRTGNVTNFEKLNELLEDQEYEYALHFTRVGTLENRDTWSQRINMGVSIVAGNTSNLGSLADGALTSASFNQALAEGVTDIGSPSDYTMRKQFSDQTPPIFVDNRPYFETGDSMINMYLMLDRPGTIYYMVAPLGTQTTTGTDKDPGGKTYNFSTVHDDYVQLPVRGENNKDTGEMEYKYNITAPSPLAIMNADNQVNMRIKYGSVSGGSTEVEKLVEGLDAKTEYIVYFVIQGSSSQIYSPVYAYQFKTGDVVKPVITLQELSPNVAYTTSQDSDINMVLFSGNELPTIFNQSFMTYVDDSMKDEFIKAAGGDEEKAKKITVLDALLKTSSSGYSWFDMYAKLPQEDSAVQTIRDTISQIVMRGQGEGGNPGATYSDDTKANVEEKHDFTANMDPKSGTSYYCIAVAKNVLGGEYSFKAVANVHIPDTTPPTLDTPGGIGIQETDKQTFKGELYLTFSENVYWIPESGDTKQICEVWNNSNYSNNDKKATINADGTITPGNVAILAHMGGASMQLKPLNYSSKASSTFEFSYTGVSIGSTLTLFSDGYLSDRSGISTREKITLRFELTQTGVEGFAQAGHWVIVE